MINFGWALILCSIGFLYFFVCVNEHGTGCMAKTKRFFWITVPETGLAIVEKTCGQKMVWVIQRTARYICYEPNPFVQIIYFICAFGGFYIYVRDGFPLFPNKRLGVWHIYNGTLIMILCYVSYFLACWVDPGKLEKGCDRAKVIHALKRFKFDGVIYQKNNKCRTCLIEKPARSKHCSMCGFCVEKFDHHCVWINQCVGLHNYKYFLSFLFLHAVICTYGVFAGY